MSSIEKQLNQIIQDNRDIEQNTALLKEYKDKLRNSNFDLAGIKDMHTIAEAILSELQKIKSEIEQAIESVAKTKDYIKFKTYTENIARIQEFRLFLQKCELFLNGKITEVALMENLETLLKDEIFQERNVEEKISAYQKFVNSTGKKMAVLGTASIMGFYTFFGGPIPNGVQEAYGMEAEANVPQDMYENIAKRMEKLNSEKKYDAAIELAKDYVNQSSNKSGLFFNELGQAERDVGNKNEAIKYFEKSIKLDPNFASPYWNLAVIYGAEKKFKITISLLEKYIELGGKNSERAKKSMDYMRKQL